MQEERDALKHKYDAERRAEQVLLHEDLEKQRRELRDEIESSHRQELARMRAEYEAQYQRSSTEAKERADKEKATLAAQLERETSILLGTGAKFNLMSHEVSTSMISILRFLFSNPP
jgi:F0F1-type ATP synthase membrane subunit b/b'